MQFQNVTITVWNLPSIEPIPEPEPKLVDFALLANNFLAITNSTGGSQHGSREDGIYNILSQLTSNSDFNDFEAKIQYFNNGEGFYDVACEDALFGKEIGGNVTGVNRELKRLEARAINCY